MNKSLKEKAISFKGKAYVLVADRVNFFNETYKNGSIITELVSAPDADRVIVKAIVRPTPEQTFTGYSQAKWSDSSSFVNKSSALENAETSAVGRALALMGIGVIDSIASVDEIKKAQNVSNKILNHEPISVDEYEESYAVDPKGLADANRQQNRERPVVYRHPEAPRGKIAVINKLNEKKAEADEIPIIDADDEPLGPIPF